MGSQFYDGNLYKCRDGLYIETGPELFCPIPRDQSRYVPSQWETSLHCNDVSHWLGTYLDRSLYSLFHAFRLWDMLIQSTSTEWVIICRHCCEDSNTAMMAYCGVVMVCQQCGPWYEWALWNISHSSIKCYVSDLHGHIHFPITTWLF